MKSSVTVKKKLSCSLCGFRDRVCYSSGYTGLISIRAKKDFISLVDETFETRSIAGDSNEIKNENKPAILGIRSL
jgi:hypothetical protein